MTLTAQTAESLFFVEGWGPQIIPLIQAFDPVFGRRTSGVKDVQDLGTDIEVFGSNDVSQPILEALERASTAGIPEDTLCCAVTCS